MDISVLLNPLHTVQLISIFSHLTKLSDFLLIENYITEDDQYKEIPVVNGLFNYIEINYNNKEMRFKLTWALLRGSNLYGEQEDEEVDEVFLDTMLDYIVTSLVFDKYGSIYGFIAKVVYSTENIQIDSFCKEMKNTLGTETFENEYGEPSTLTPLATDRIFTDLILPLFPQPNSNSNYTLSSIDYIYAQAGANFLKSGVRNITLFNNVKEHYKQFLDEDTTFDQYIGVGHILENLILSKNVDELSLGAFAVPALCNYILLNKKLIETQNITNIISDSFYWQAAYEQLFSYIDNTFDELERHLKVDNVHKLHLEFLDLNTRTTVAKAYVELFCPYLNKQMKNLRISQYLMYPDYFQCRGNGDMLPNLTKLYMDELSMISNIYYLHELTSIQEAFGDSLIQSLLNTDVIITLFIPENFAASPSYDSKYLPYDLLTFYYPQNSTEHNYVLIHENYSVKLIKENDNPQFFQEKIGSSFEKLQKGRSHMVLKSNQDKLDTFWGKIAQYKTNRLISHLMSLDDKLPQNDWWKEFGLSLIPFYKCLSTTSAERYKTGPFCYLDKNLFLRLAPKSENVASKMTHKNTESFLSSKQMSVESMYLRQHARQAINKIESLQQVNNLTVRSLTNSNVFKKLLLHLHDPGFELKFLSSEHINALTLSLENLSKIMIKHFLHVIIILQNMSVLNLNFVTRFEKMDLKLNSNLYVQSQLSEEHTGYGYKFVYLTSDKIAQLRTDYELKREILVSLIPDSTENEHYPSEIRQKMYVRINETTLQKENGQIYYEYNGQLHRNATWTDSEMSIPRNSSNNCEIENDIVGPSSLNQCPRDKFLDGPKWSENYIIKNRDLLFQLRYGVRMENTTITEKNAEVIINSIYTMKERHEIESRTSLTKIVKAYNKNKEYYSTSFEDYYALENYVTTGYTRISGDTNEARRMKVALYKVAIRQSDDLVPDLNLTLYRVEYKPTKFIDKHLSPSKTFKLQKFTSTFVNKASALKFALDNVSDYKPILYTYKFLKPYLSAKIKVSSFEQIILLPETKFFIQSVDEDIVEGSVHVKRVVLKNSPNVNNKYGWYLNIMNEITKVMI